MDGISVLVKETQRAPSSLVPCELTGEGQLSRRWALPRYQICWQLDLALLASIMIYFCSSLAPQSIVFGYGSLNRLRQIQLLWSVKQG